MKLIISFLILFVSAGLAYSQYEVSPSDTVITKTQEFDEMRFPSNYHSEYKRLLRKVKRVYPLALHAAFVIDSLDTALAEEEKKRRQKKIARKTHNQLKDEFKFLLKSLYVSEGVVLSKLIHRETGMTVEEIIETYKGGTQATLYRSLASMFDQELDATYDPDDKDFILECIIRDIHLGKIDFDDEFEKLTKADFKEDRKEYKKRVRANKKKVRQLKKEKRKASQNTND
jgi:hypothetical protein